MRRMVDSAKVSPAIREFAIRLTSHLPQKDRLGEIRALWRYVKYHIRYIHDVQGVETLQTPDKTLALAAGDCDDKCTLLATLLESIGYKTRFKAVGFSGDDICHVLIEVRENGRWIPLETTEPVAIGWQPPLVKNREYF